MVPITVNIKIRSARYSTIHYQFCWGGWRIKFRIRTYIFVHFPPFIWVQVVEHSKHWKNTITTGIIAWCYREENMRAPGFSCSMKNYIARRSTLHLARLPSSRQLRVAFRSISWIMRSGSCAWIGQPVAFALFHHLDAVIVDSFPRLLKSHHAWLQRIFDTNGFTSAITASRRFAFGFLKLLQYISNQGIVACCTKRSWNTILQSNTRIVAFKLTMNQSHLRRGPR